ELFEQIKFPYRPSALKSRIEALIDKEYRSATVKAKKALKILELTNENLHIFAKHYRNGFTWVVVNIARVLSTRLREVNKRLAEAKSA
ncbi:MAG: hypothetical protein AAFY60_04700, partial [Myxococcota bacterium]